VLSLGIGLLTVTRKTRSPSGSLGLRVPGGLRVAHQRAKFNADLGWCLSPLMPGGPYPATLLALAGERDPGALG